jgi:hypothetical protein
MSRLVTIERCHRKYRLRFLTCRIAEALCQISIDRFALVQCCASAKRSINGESYFSFPAMRNWVDR